MSLTVRMLGTGSAFSNIYNNNNALLEYHGRKLLIDCGNTAMRALYQMNESIADLDGVLVTHLHADHIGGLEELAFRMNILHKRKPKLFIADDLVTPIWEHSLRAGLEDEIHHQLEDYFEVIPLQKETAVEILPGLKVRLIATKHIPGKISYSLIFNDALFYSADMTFDPDLLYQCWEQGIRNFMHECQLTGIGTVHTTLKELLTLPEEIQSCILLMHYGDEREQFEGETGKMKFMEQQQLYTFQI